MTGSLYMSRKEKAMGIENTIVTLEDIANKAGCEWKNDVLIENDTDNPLVDAYNEGVRGMAAKVTYMVAAILNGIAFKERYDALKKEGWQ